MRRLVARFYRTMSGEEPVRDWLSTMDSLDRRTIGIDVASVEFGWPLHLPQHDVLGRGIIRLRSNMRHGNKEARIYFSVHVETMLLLHGECGEIDGEHVAGDRLRDHQRRGPGSMESKDV